MGSSNSLNECEYLWKVRPLATTAVGAGTVTVVVELSILTVVIMLVAVVVTVLNNLVCSRIIGKLIHLHHRVSSADGLVDTADSGGTALGINLGLNALASHCSGDILVDSCGCGCLGHTGDEGRGEGSEGNVLLGCLLGWGGGDSHCQRQEERGDKLGMHC